jgi:putative sterol carrier protein
MPRYLSPEWVESFNAALSGLDLSDAISAAGAGSLTASDGAFCAAQVVTGAPEGTVRTVLIVGEGHAARELDNDTARRAHVTMVLDYADAIAMARGELDPADALAAGRVRVRGELAVLVAGQSVLAAAAAQLGTALADLTDANDANDPTDLTD